MSVGDMVRITVDHPQGMTEPYVQGEIGQIIHKIGDYYIVDTLLMHTTRFWYAEDEIVLATDDDMPRLIEDYQEYASLCLD